LDASTTGKDEFEQDGCTSDQRGSAKNRRRGIRLPTDERRRQVGRAAVSLMTRYGLRGTTVGRIADIVGMEPPSLYSHFPSRREMLLAGMDVIFERVDKWLHHSSDSNILNRLTDITESHLSFMTGEFEGFVAPAFHFITAPPESGLPKIIGQKQLATVNAIAALVEEGKRQGTIRKDMDSRLAAWEITVFAWAEDVARLMELDEYLADGMSKRIMDLFLRDMAATGETTPPDTVG
jgi:AcrR family transcriptional regulator